jgi:hypothetical protein
VKIKIRIDRINKINKIQSRTTKRTSLGFGTYPEFCVQRS